MVDRREKMRQESLALDQLCFDQQMFMRDLRQRFGFKDESDGLYHVKVSINCNGRPHWLMLVWVEEIKENRDSVSISCMSMESTNLWNVLLLLLLPTSHTLAGLSKQQRSAHGHGGLSMLPGEGDEVYSRGAVITTSAHDELFAKRIEEELQQRRARDMGWRDITEVSCCCCCY
jgi:hypothetical protein